MKEKHLSISPVFDEDGDYVESVIVCIEVTRDDRAITFTPKVIEVDRQTTIDFIKTIADNEAPYKTITNHW